MEMKWLYSASFCALLLSHYTLFAGFRDIELERRASDSRAPFVNEPSQLFLLLIMTINFTATEIYRESRCSRQEELESRNWFRYN